MIADWFTHFIFSTKLIDSSHLSEKEVIALTGYLKERKTYSEIAKLIGVTDGRVQQLIENGIGKILLTTKDLLAKTSLLQTTLAEKKLLEYELTQLRNRFKKELDEEQKILIKVKPLEIRIDDIRLSVRAKKILEYLNIKYTRDLISLTRKKLYSIDKAGVKTVEEIIRIAEEYGIKIT